MVHGIDEELIDAAEKGDLKRVEELLERGTDVNATTKDGWTPLHLAARRGHVDVARLLLERGADPDARDNLGRTPAMLAWMRRHTGIMYLIEG